MKKRVLVLDTSAFIAGFDPFTISEKQYTVREVKDEFIRDSVSLMRFNAAIENGKLLVMKPTDACFQEILETSKNVEDTQYLSATDLQVLAIALELKDKGFCPLIVTDDYSIQNVANKINVDFASLMTFGIKSRFKWVLYCPACYRKFPSDFKFKSCEVCGTKLKRKPKKKTPL